MNMRLGIPLSISCNRCANIKNGYQDFDNVEFDRLAELHILALNQDGKNCAVL